MPACQSLTPTASPTPLPPPAFSHRTRSALATTVVVQPLIFHLPASSPAFPAPRKPADVVAHGPPGAKQPLIPGPPQCPNRAELPHPSSTPSPCPVAPGLPRHRPAPLSRLPRLSFPTPAPSVRQEVEPSMLAQVLGSSAVHNGGPVSAGRRSWIWGVRRGESRRRVGELQSSAQTRAWAGRPVEARRAPVWCTRRREAFLLEWKRSPADYGDWVRSLKLQNK